jgi:type IV fimbrial biogenesis protein FimT
MMRARRNGFSLLELMVTVAIAAILLAVAVPNLRTFMRRNTITSETNDLIGDLQFARSTAVNRRILVAVCAKSSTAVSCAGTNTYENGWLIYIPTSAGAVYAGTGVITGATADTTILRVGTAPANIAIRGLNTTPVTFNQRGELTSGTDMTFAVCSKATSTATAGESVSGATGVTVTQSSSGRTASTPIAVAGSCTPT